MNSVSEILDLSDALTGISAPRAWLGRLADFYELTKPRMNFLVVITTMVGYCLASPGGHIDWLRLLHTLFGTALTAAGASVFNQLIELRFDALMPRTRNRPMPTCRIAPGEALAFGTVLSATGIAFLSIFVNPLTAILGAVTLFGYIAIYTPMKRRSTLNTIVGAIPALMAES